jgi:outer membrane protein TolC
MRFVPVISSAWSGSYQFTDPGDLGSDDRSRMIAMFSLTVPIYDHFRYGELHSRRALVKKSELEIDNAELGITMEVRKARRDYMAALASAEAARTQADLSKEALSLTEAAYNAGTGNSLDVTDARRTALQSDVNYATRRLEAQTALLRLIYSIGEDLSLLGKE